MEMEIEKNENLVTEPVTENVEQTTEQTPKMFTQEEVNEIVGKAKARTRAKIEKENQRKYGRLEEVLRAGTGKETVEEMSDTFEQFYEGKGIKMPQKPTYTDSDIAVLARADADDIIRSGYDDVVEEVDRLTAIGYANMDARQKAVFKVLAEYRLAEERGRELAGIGVTQDVYNSKEFTDFAAQFDKKTPITDVYKLYAKTTKPEVETIGSMKNGSHDEGKTFYTPEEVDRLTPQDYDNPVIFRNVRNSMKLWK